MREINGITAGKPLDKVKVRIGMIMSDKNRITADFLFF